MNERDFFLAAYDVANARRLAAALHLMGGYAAGAQKSVHECFRTTGERNDLMHQMPVLLEEDTDRALLFDDVRFIDVAREIEVALKVNNPGAGRNSTALRLQMR